VPKFNHPEHDFQRAVIAFLHRALPAGSIVFSMDSAKSGSSIQRIKDKERGILAGLPDTVAFVRGFPAITFELKSPTGVLSDAQIERGRQIQESGHFWFTASALEHIESALRTIGVPLRATVGERAERIAAGSGPPVKRGKARGKPMAPKPTAGQVARINALRMKVLF
jgi:hypothetical protein